MLRKLAAAVVGIIVAIAAIQVVELLGHLVYPPPADIEFDNVEQVREFMASLPTGSILFVGAAWAVGTFLGTLAGALLSKSKPLPYAIVVGGIVLAGAATMLLMNDSDPGQDPSQSLLRLWAGEPSWPADQEPLGRQGVRVHVHAAPRAMRRADAVPVRWYDRQYHRLPLRVHVDCELLRARRLRGRRRTANMVRHR
jgi:hypothetical protein